MNRRTLLASTITAALLLVLTALAQSPPAWLSGHGALIHGASADDFAAINQGQLKNLARAAWLEMNAKLPGGAGPALDQLIDSWDQSASADDFAAVNQGQLKALSALFYERLEAVRVELAPAWPPIQAPWLRQDAPPSDHSAIANIGQAKYLIATLEGNRAAHSAPNQNGDASGYAFGLSWFQDLNGDGNADIHTFLPDNSPPLPRISDFPELLWLRVTTPLQEW